MKKVLYTSFTAVGLLLSSITVMAQNVGIGTITPNTSAGLDITATNKGLLIPRVNLTTSTDAVTIASPATSLLVYNTNSTLGAGYYFNSGTPASPVWSRLLTAAASSGWGLTGNAGTNPSTNFIGTTTNVPLRIRTNNVVVGQISRENLFIGDSSGISTNEAVGTDNIGIGINAIYYGDTGFANIGIGSYALALASGDIGSVGIGYQALVNNDDPTGQGNFNTAVGALAGSSIGYLGEGYYNTALGSFADCYDATNSLDVVNSTAIGSGALADVSNMVRIGDDFVEQIGGAVDWSVLSDGRFKKDIKNENGGLNFIMQLRPVNYHYNFTKLNDSRIRSIKGANKMARNGKDIANNDMLLKKFTSNGYKQKISQNETKTYNGLIAQEVEAAAKKIGYNFSGVVTPTKPDGKYALRYATFVVPLIEAVQEQQKTIEAQDKKIEALEKRLLKLELR
ncbi:tail fiber domain-containing protein [Ferruginibacter lapsinanis]|uniref:tail fiber domain-containing protein n=1 Tax=Ferruginibacter lapsinanis TaxID=563172 RepID=UPI001E3C4408|nr:tail fiber domain-containing protein [Ferruginibacter lapsinanis]UEG51031.1 tail fiber domain-containing protein [Ferruginibacter lapsinanis]